MNWVIFTCIMILAIIITTLCMSMYDVYKGNVKKGAKHMRENLICNFIGTFLVAVCVIFVFLLFIA